MPLQGNKECEANRHVLGPGDKPVTRERGSVRQASAEL